MHSIIMGMLSYNEIERLSTCLWGLLITIVIAAACSFDIGRQSSMHSRAIVSIYSGLKIDIKLSISRMANAATNIRND